MPTGENFGTNVPQTTITAPFNAGATLMPVLSSSGYPATPFTAVLGIGTSLQEAIYVTNVSGTTWTVTRGYDGTVQQNHPLNQTVTHADIGLHFREFRAHLDASSGVHGVTGSVVGTTDPQNLSNKNLQTPTITTANFSGAQNMGSGLFSGTGGITNRGTTDWFNVKALGAKGDGVQDDTTYINNALSSAATAGGGTVFLPAGTYRITSAITFPQASTNVKLLGEGACAGNILSTVLGATIIKPDTGAQYDAIVTALPGTPGTAGFVSYGNTVQDLAIDCTNVTGTTTGKGNGVHFYGVRYGRLQNVQVFNCPNYAFLMEGDNPTNYSYNITMVECFAGNCAAGARFTNSEQALLQRCVFEGANNSTAATQPYSGTSSTTNAYMLYMNTGWIFAEGCTFGSLGNTTREAVFVDNGETCLVRGCLFDSVRGPVFHSTSGNHVIAGNAIENPCAAGGGSFVISLGAGGHVICDNVFHNVTAANFTYCIGENGAYAGNNIHNNFLITGSSGTIATNVASTPVIHHNVGYNPKGNIAIGGPPTSGSSYQNQFGSDATVYISGGTVSAIAIGGVATGFTSGTFRVAANQTITLTYTVAPTTYKWYLD